MSQNLTDVLQDLLELLFANNKEMQSKQFVDAKENHASQADTITRSNNNCELKARSWV